ncbi:Crp/Fnr family transcriptional regulator [Rugamonas sp. CCM 8940]|nr:Crp/Fnr family transcriptional regulator [Rugamonas sp. CCM 8940]
MPTLYRPDQNRLLAALEPAESARLAPHLELLRLLPGDVLYQSGGKLMYVYFPITAVVSIQYELENGGSCEIASVGHGGLLGVSLFMGGRTTPSRAVVQNDGYAYRLSAARLVEEFHRRGPLFGLLLRYTQVLMTEMAQTAVCNAHHSTQQRLCRWLLQMLDHTHSSEVAITQEALGAILGVRREGITEAAGRLQMTGLISYRRGHVRVLSRTGLEAMVCECHRALRRESDRLMAPRHRADAGIQQRWLEREAVHTRRTGRPERRGDGAHDAEAGDSQADLQFP